MPRKYDDANHLTVRKDFVDLNLEMFVVETFVVEINLRYILNKKVECGTRGTSLSKGEVTELKFS